VRHGREERPWLAAFTLVAHRYARVRVPNFCSHEVRNPVAAAMAACSFVKQAVNEPIPLATEEARRNTRDDVDVISNALNFVHDLLRNMLDIHRFANKNLKLTLIPTDLLRDVLEPVVAMLHQRRSKIAFLLECPENLHINTDRLRLKQIVLNLSRNSTKFVDEGFIRIHAAMVDGLVELSVEDSGPGIPAEKRNQLFSKFQQSLDNLSQGTVRTSREFCSCLIGNTSFRFLCRGLGSTCARTWPSF
jgi:two-component system, OmpR family, sensor histidine kinase KdpD